MTRFSVGKLLLCGLAGAKQEARFILQSSHHSGASCEVTTAEEKLISTDRPYLLATASAGTYDATSG